METTNIIEVAFGTKREAVARPLYQWDYGQTLKISDLTLPTAYQVQFAKEKNGLSVQQIGGADGVSIPDFLFFESGNIYAWFFLHDFETDGETRYEIYIPVLKRAQPPIDTPTPAQEDAISEAIKTINECRKKIKLYRGEGGEVAEVSRRLHACRAEYELCVRVKALCVPSRNTRTNNYSHKGSLKVKV